MDEIGYNYNVFRPFSYLTILAQIVSLSILGYVVLRMVLAAVFQIEKRMDKNAPVVQLDEYRQIEEQ